MRSSEEVCRARLGAAAVARLATVTPDGAPHLVPITFALRDDELWFAIDHKPKSTTDLARVRNLRHEPRAAILADEYDDDWRGLWWVRGDGIGRELPAEERGPALDALAAKYPQYRELRPEGPVVAVRITRWTGWAASDPG
ncbi:MAG: TIGR03668 family PPOX class F420-dependent oxidoreductase [Acidimicrobiia bacterium]